MDVVPLSKRRSSPVSVRGGGGDPRYHPSGVTGVSNSASSFGGRGSGNRPASILECSSCGVTSSPEWRKGPSGKKELCNA